MRSNFPGFYSLSKELLDEVWGKAVLILDTNVLLDFYRVSPDTQSDLLRVVKYYAEQNLYGYLIKLLQNTMIIFIK